MNVALNLLFKKLISWRTFDGYALHVYMTSLRCPCTMVNRPYNMNNIMTSSILSATIFVSDSQNEELHYHGGAGKRQDDSLSIP